MQARESVVAVELDSTVDVLARARDQRRVVMTAEAEILRCAVVWAEQHPPESIAHAATWPGTEGELLLAGEGAPLVAEFCLPELAAALGLTTDAGRDLVAQALELKYRLPRVWARVLAGDLPAWRARRIARETIGLSREAATFVDAHVAAHAHRIGPAQLDRLVAEATARYMPAKAEEDARRADEGRHVTVDHRQVTFNGTTRVEAELDLADALDLEAAVGQGAQQLKLAGCEESLDVRRSMAVGDLARRQLALDLPTQPETDSAAEPAPAPRNARRQVVLHVHLSEAAVTGTGEGLHLARVENRNRVVTAQQVRAWCASPDAHVVVKPVIDLAEHVRVDQYEIPDRLREQTVLRDGACVFPWCTRPARSCDVDHAVPYAEGGATASDNLAPLCRRHHRVKTHSPWSYTVLEPGNYLWSSPHGYQFLRDSDGTLDVSRDLGARRDLGPPGQRST